MLKIFSTAAEIHHFFSLRFASPRLDHLTTVILKKNSGEAGSISHHSVHNYSSNSTTIQLMTVRVGLAFTGGRPACAMGSSLWSLLPTVLFKEPLSKLSGHGIGRTMAIWRVYMGIPYCLFGHIQTSSGYVSNSIQFRSDL
jgi:hypothetical protein